MTKHQINNSTDPMLFNPIDTDGLQADSNNACTSLITMIRYYHPIKDSVEKKIRKNAKYQVFKKGDILPSSTQVDNNIYFILKGVVRGVVNEDGVEITTWFSKEGRFVGDIYNTMSIDFNESIQALEDVEVVVITLSFLNSLYAESVEINIVGRKIMERFYQEVQERNFICRLPSAERKYLYFINKFPDIINRVNLKYIATFLGIRVETLSRVRAKL